MPARVGSACDVLVVGSLNTDLVVHVPRLPRPGETVVGGALQELPGGKGGNAAVAAARLRAQVALCGAVGPDDRGRDLLADLERDGVDTRWVSRSDAASGAALILVEAGGENVIAAAAGANAELRPRDVEAAVKGARPSVLLASLEVPLAAVAAGCAAAPAGCRRVLNASPVDVRCRPLLADVDVLIVNEPEATELAATSDAAQAARALGGLGPAVVVTQGAQGALLAVGGGVRHVPAWPVEAIDTVGAGDAFVGVLAAALSYDVPLDDAVDAAAAGAALATTRPGARSGLPTLAELADYVRSRGVRLPAALARRRSAGPAAPTPGR